MMIINKAICPSLKPIDEAAKEAAGRGVLMDLIAELIKLSKKWNSITLDTDHYSLGKEVAFGEAADELDELISRFQNDPPRYPLPSSPNR